MAAVRYGRMLSQGLIILFIMAATEGKPNRINYYIRRTWDGDSVNHPAIHVSLEGPIEDGVKLTIIAPFFNDSDIPPGEAGQPVWKLWDYEVVEAFFLGDNENYIEIEISPFGQHIVLLLKGARNAVNFCLPLSVKSSISRDKKTWTGVAKIPAAYFPVNVNKFNLYAIHGKEATRTYLALYPAPKGKHPSADFHRLEYFQYIPFHWLLPQNPSSTLTPELWDVKKDPSKGCQA